MADNFTSKTAAGTSKTHASTDPDGLHVSGTRLRYHIISRPQRLAPDHLHNGSARLSWRIRCDHRRR